MKLSLCLGAALLVAAVAGAPTAGDHDAARTAYVAEINAMPGILWQARVNSKFKVAVQLARGDPSRPTLGLWTCCGALPFPHRPPPSPPFHICSTCEPPKYALS